MLNNDNLSVNDFGKICRTCLAQGEMKYLFENCPKEVCLIEMLMSCTFVQFSEKDGLPVQICLNCVDEITKAYKFAQKSIEVDKALRKCFNEHEDKIKQKIKSTVSRGESITTEQENIEVQTISLQTENTNTTVEQQIKTEIELNPEIILVKPEILSLNNDKEIVDSDSDFLPEIEDANIDDPEENCELKPDKQCRGKRSKFKSGPPYECKKCLVKFATYKLLWLHWKEVRHPKTSKVSCRICSKQIECSGINIHMRTHTLEKPYVCKLCGKTFSVKGNLDRHVKIHTGVKPHKCNFCEKAFIQSTSLKEHLRIHTGEKPYICNMCGRGFAQANRLKEHIRTHTGEKPFTCNTCGKCFTSNGLYKLHLNTHTTDKPDSSTKHKKHIRTSTGSKSLHECDICQRKFTTKRILNTHILIHGEKKFLCNHCGMGFVTKGGLDSHIRIHTGEKSYSCTFCDRKFSHIGNVKSHILTHTGEKPYVCKICNRGFTQGQHLRHHMRVHSGEKPFPCEYCGKSFRLKVNLRVHTRIHTGETPYLCPICNKGFYDSSSMKKHKLKHEKVVS